MGSITIQIEIEGWGEQDEGGYNIAEFTVAVSDDEHYIYYSANYIFQKASKKYFSKINV